MNAVDWTDEIYDFVCRYIKPERIVAVFGVHPRDLRGVTESMSNPGYYGTTTDDVDDLADFLSMNAHLFSPEVIERIHTAQAVFALEDL